MPSIVLSHESPNHNPIRTENIYIKVYVVTKSRTNGDGKRGQFVNNTCSTPPRQDM